VRHLVFLKPEVLVVFDLVITPADRQPIWLLQTVHPPRVLGATLQAENGDGALHVVRLLPDDAQTRVVEVPGTAVYGQRSHGPPHYRTEVKAHPGHEHRFLHVIHVTEARPDSPLQAVARSDEGELVIDVGMRHLAWHVVLRFDGEPHVKVKARTRVPVGGVGPSDGNGWPWVSRRFRRLGRRRDARNEGPGRNSGDVLIDCGGELVHTCFARGAASAVQVNVKALYGLMARSGVTV
jgi:hypothetical protein